MSTNKRTASSLLNDDNETKKLKTETSSPTTTTANKETIPSFIDENTSSKKICPYAESCYRQKNALHTAEYDHPCK